MQADVDYDQILVPIVGTRVSDEMMVLACQLATEKKSSIDGLYVIEVPLNLPLDARLASERAKADKVLKAGGADRRQFKVEFTPHVVTARQAGRAIVEEAGERRSEVIILGTDAQAAHRATASSGGTTRLRPRPRALRGPRSTSSRRDYPYGGLRARRSGAGRRARRRPAGRGPPASASGRLDGAEAER